MAAQGVVMVPEGRHIFPDLTVQEGLGIPLVKGTADAIQNPFFKQIASEVEKSQWIAIAIDQQLGPDTGRVFNDVCAEMAAGNSSAEQAAKTIEDSWAQNRM
jgi:raffinose/stachyose/melibiose transport system substrate-binding protein